MYDNTSQSTWGARKGGDKAGVQGRAEDTI